MKVLHVIDRLETGGAERLFVSITKLLAARGVETGALLFTAGSSLDKELDKRVQLHVLNRRGKYNLLTLYKAHKICSSYDIVHTHLRHVYAYIRLAQWLFRGKYKLLVHDHAAVTSDIPKRYAGIFKPRYYIGVNKGQTAWAVSTVGVYKEHVFLLENTVMPVANNENKTDNPKDLMMVANIRAVKNAEFAIELTKRMNATLDIYGNIIGRDYYNRLLQDIDNDKIRMIHDVSDMTHLYGNYKMAIHCSPAETGPLVLIEYLAAGLPFIAYKTGSAAEAIAEELPQLFMDNFEYEDWRKRIEDILSDSSLPDKMKTLYTKRFNPEDYTNKCLDIYRKIYSS